jgi:CBS domain-containing protein
MGNSEQFPAGTSDLSELERFFSEPALGRLGAAIADAGDTEHLAVAAQAIRAFAAELVGYGIGARQVTEMLSSLSDRLAGRLLQIHAAAEGLDPGHACWLVFGSEGRSEQTIVTDQDNGLVFESTQPSRDRERWLALGQRINEALSACGYSLCKGRVMAGDPACCLTAAEWCDRIASWIEHGSPDDLLRACIYFDLRPVAGDHRLARPLQDLVVRQARAVPRFLKQMADNALRNPAPLSWLGSVETRKLDGRSMFDLKHHGTMLFVDAARIYALAHGIALTGTRQRFEAIAAVLRVPAHESEAWVRGFEFLQMLRLQAQAASPSTGRAANMLDVASLNDIDRLTLKETLRVAQRLQQRMQLDYQR